MSGAPVGSGADDGPLVLLPGMNCSAALWSTVPLTGLPRVLAPRLIEPTITGQVDRLLDELPSRFRLAGLSLGAVVAMALTRTAPERVTSLALLSTNPHAPTTAQRAGWHASRVALEAGRTARALQAEWLPGLLSLAASADADLVELTLRMADEVGEVELDAQLAMQATRIDERPGLTRLRCPVRVVAAAEDALVGVDRHREIARLVPGAELTIVPCGHLSPLERPDVIGAELRRLAYPTSAAPSASVASLA